MFSNKYLWALLGALISFILVLLFQFDLNHVETVKEHMQYMDMTIIEGDFFMSILNIHFQPPLLNTVIGGLSSLFGFTNTTLNVYLIFISFLNILVIFEILKQLKLSLIWAIPYLAYPSFLLYSYWAYEAHLSLLLINLALLGLLHQNQKLGFLFLSISCALLPLQHSIFHPFIIITLYLLVLVVKYKSVWVYNKYKVVAGLVVLLPLIWMTKNDFLFGSFSMSSGLGCNLYTYAKVVNQDLDKGFFAFNPTNKLDIHPILGNAMKYNESYINYNHLDLIDYCDCLLDESKTILFENIKVLPNIILTKLKNTESLPSYLYQCCGFEFEHWGRLGSILSKPIFNSKLINFLVLGSTLLSPFLFLIWCLLYRRWHLIALPLLYWFHLVIIYTVNSAEQERMGFKFSFFHYLAIVLFIDYIVKKGNAYVAKKNSTDS